MPFAVALFVAIMLVQASGQFASPSYHGLAVNQPSCFGLNGVDDSFIPGLVASERIAVVRPIFTSTPYSQYRYGSFYAFYTKYRNANGNITADLGWLSTNISSGEGFNQGWGFSYGLYGYLTSSGAQACGLLIGNKIHILDDISVSAGELNYLNGSARFDAVVVPFSEYVTVNEYQNYENFVAKGGTLVLLSAHSIEWFVDFNTTTKMETFVRGHGFAYNGRSAWRLPCTSANFSACPWAGDYIAWIGSTPYSSPGVQYGGAKVNTSQVIGKALAKEFGNMVFNTYRAHEENSLRNMSGTSVVATFSNQSNTLVASYVHDFGVGKVVCMCVFGDDIIGSDASAQYLLVLGIISASLYPKVVCYDAIGSAPRSCVVSLKGWNPTGSVSWSFNGATAISSVTCQLLEGNCSVKVPSSVHLPSYVTVRYSGDSQNAPSARVFKYEPTTISYTPTTTIGTNLTSITGGLPQTGPRGLGAPMLLGISVIFIAATAAVAILIRVMARRYRGN